MNTHSFDLKFVAFCLEFNGDSYVKFQEITISGEFFTQTKAISTKTCEISPYFLQFLFCVRIALKKFTQVLSYVVCTQERRNVHKEYTGKKSQDILFSENQFCSLSGWDLLRLTPWVFWFENFTKHSSLCLLVFAEIWAPNSSHKTGNKLFIDQCQSWKEGSFVWNWLIFFMGEYISVWHEICRVLSRIQWRFLHGVSETTYFGIIF